METDLEEFQAFLFRSDWASLLWSSLPKVVVAFAAVVMFSLPTVVVVFIMVVFIVIFLPAPPCRTPLHRLIWVLTF